LEDEEMLNKIFHICIGIILAGSLLFMSCSTPETKSVSPVSPQIKDLHDDIKSAKETLATTTTKIKDNATAGLEKTPPAAKPILEPHWREILIQGGIQENVVKDLERAQTKTLEVESKAKEFEQAYKTAKENEEKAKNIALKELREKYIWISVACFSILIISILVAITGFGGGQISKMAIGVALTAGIGLAISIALVQTFQYIPYIVAGVALIAGGFGIWFIFKKNKTIAVTTEKNEELDKIATELVHTGEIIKPHMKPNARIQIFGAPGVIGDIHHLQSAETKSFVRAKREELKEHGLNPAPPITDQQLADFNGDGVIDEKDEEFRKKGDVAVYVGDEAAEIEEEISDGVRKKRCGRRIKGPRIVSGARTIIILK
jgi:hypothetical protein